ncbi:MAG TPA: 1-phosphofructokinase family hexose kinase [Actinophytocola sp.]|uniref:1-phosphofructokinase family hexose kinase n=1 Tax=Actinophytocola sp. TaxID=1872138 RepID=UPI002F94AFFF
MILTVTLNAALDVTYHVPALVPGATHRASPTGTRAGGKGVNVARVLHALGHDVQATGFAGGDTGAAIRADLAASGIREAFVEPSAAARRTVTVVSEQDGTATAFNEPGPRLSIEDWTWFVGRYHELASRADVVVLSGSLPPGLPDHAYAQLLGATPVPAILDTSGAPLLEGAAARPHVVKPNADELAVTGEADPLAAARRLRSAGAGAVVASRGADGLVAVTGEGCWRAAAPEPLHGNPTGAGDACVAALAGGVAAGAPWPAVLADAVALSAAAVARPLAGDVDTTTYRRLVRLVSVEELDADLDR